MTMKRSRDPVGSDEESRSGGPSQSKEAPSSSARCSAFMADVGTKLGTSTVSCIQSRKSRALRRSSLRSPCCNHTNTCSRRSETIGRAMLRSSASRAAWSRTTREPSGAPRSSRPEKQIRTSVPASSNCSTKGPAQAGCAPSRPTITPPALSWRMLRIWVSQAESARSSAAGAGGTMCFRWGRQG